MIPTTNQRWSVVQQLIDLYGTQPALATVLIRPKFPVGEIEAEMIWLSNIEGVVVEIPHQTGPTERLTRDDTFLLTWRIWVDNADDLMPTIERATEIIGAIEDVFATDVEIGMPDVVLSAEVTNENGPLPIDSDAEGTLVVADITVQVQLRLY